MTNPLAYVHTPIPDDGVFKISPSQFAQFISYPHQWYRSQILKENVFSHNTASVLGTIVHYCAEMVGRGEDVSRVDIGEYIDSLAIHDEYDSHVVQSLYNEMAERLVNDYVNQNKFLEIETQHKSLIKDGYYAAGTLDALQGTKADCMIVDYKTYNSKSKPKTIPPHYKYQLLVYAHILKNNGYNPTRVRLVYINRNIEGEISIKTGKQNKSYPPEVTVLTQYLTSNDYLFIEGLLDLCVDSCIAAKKYPELTHVIFHDPRLKP